MISDSGEPRRVIAYIDGFNLYFGLKDSGWRRYWLDVSKLARSLLPDNAELARAASAHFVVARTRFRDSQLPPQVLKPDRLSFGDRIAGGRREHFRPPTRRNARTHRCVGCGEWERETSMYDQERPCNL